MIENYFFYILYVIIYLYDAFVGSRSENKETVL